MLSGTNSSNEWVHEVINYVGPNNGDDFGIYQNGEFLFNVRLGLTVNTFPPSNGRIVIGRSRTDENLNYASVQVDEVVVAQRGLN